MAKLRLSKSIRKYLRREKARLRRESLDPQEAEVRRKELVTKVLEKYNGDIKVHKAQ